MSLKVSRADSLGDWKPMTPLSPQQPRAPPPSKPRAISSKAPPADSLGDSKPMTPVSLSSKPRASSPKIPPASPIEKPKEAILRKIPPSSELPTPPASIRMLPLRAPEGEKKKYIWEVAVEERERDVWREHRYHYTKATDARASVAFAVKDPRKRKVRWWKWLFVW
ncbi:hypothetical protein BD779DRAFT_1672699 [Infundibulicybe gibba]|nr:hypothetical protein BD779DRAFT_1672699 [Infundibulicybe gibba]